MCGVRDYVICVVCAMCCMFDVATSTHTYTQKHTYTYTHTVTLTQIHTDCLIDNEWCGVWYELYVLYGACVCIQNRHTHKTNTLTHTHTHMCVLIFSGVLCDICFMYGGCVRRQIRTHTQRQTHIHTHTHTHT